MSGVLRRRLLLAPLIATVLVAAACSSVGHGAPKATASSVVRGDVVVLAASSLTSALTTIAREFESVHPGVHVRLSFDGSSRLAAQIMQGVPADVFVSADQPTMDRVAKSGRIDGSAEIVATNELEIVVSRDNPKDIRGIEDLTRGAVVALCRVEVPCGAYAAQAFRAAGLDVPAAGREDNVKAVLSKVQLGEADAGIVYRTDVLSAEGVQGIEIARSDQIHSRYPAAVLKGAPNPSAAAAFDRYLVSREARAVLAKVGFGPP